MKYTTDAMYPLIVAALQASIIGDAIDHTERSEADVANHAVDYAVAALDALERYKKAQK